MLSEMKEVIDNQENKSNHIENECHTPCSTTTIACRALRGSFKNDLDQNSWKDQTIK